MCSKIFIQDQTRKIERYTRNMKWEEKFSYKDMVKISFDIEMKYENFSYSPPRFFFTPQKSNFALDKKFGSQKPKFF
jgi:hypothetical protein